MIKLGVHTLQSKYNIDLNVALNQINKVKDILDLILDKILELKVGNKKLYFYENKVK